jgi:hypothetical protein
VTTFPPTGGTEGGSAADITPTLKIAVTSDGLYQLTHDDLANAGLDAIDPRTLKLSQRGLEIPIYVPGEDDGLFDPGDVLLFYGTAITDVYTTANVYWLTAGGSAGQRMDERDGGLSGSAPVPAHFPVTHHAEQDTYYWVTMPHGQGQDHWFWGDKLTAPVWQDHTLPLHHISTTASTATVRVRLKGHTDAATYPDHHTRIYLNGVEVDDQFWDGFDVYEHQVALPHTNLNEGNNPLRVQGAGDTGAAVDQFFVNWIEIDYWDTYVAENDALLFGAPESGTYQFEISDFGGDEVEAFDVSDPSSVVRIVNTNVVDDGGSYTLQFEDSAQPATRYLAQTPARRKSPTRLWSDQPSSWRSPANGADYILITHADFYSSALRLADHHAASGLRVVTVKVEDIYDEFNDGIFNPRAIRDFLTYAYQYWTAPAPTYVLLLGGASYDYRDLLDLDRANYVPTQIIETDTLGQTPSDNWFVLVNGADLLPDMFIGRLTAQSVSQADDVVDKIIYYEEHPPDDSWNTQMLLVADDEAVFESISEQIAARLPFYYTAHKVYSADYPPGDPTHDIRAAINAGSLLVNYAGHGNVDRWGAWSEGGILNRGDVAALNNTHKLPVVTIANCLNGYFAGKNVSLAEEFMLREDRGAVAVWAASGLGYPSGHRTLMREFYDAVFQDDVRALGAATTAAKIATYGQSSFWGELVETFVLFGDPATPLGAPTNYPYLKSTTPADGAANVPVDQDLQIVFSKPMHPATVTLSDATFVPMWNAAQTVVNYVHPYLAYSQTLTFTVQGQDRLGNPLIPGLVPNTWSFTTAPPRPVESVGIAGPAWGAVNVAYTFGASVSPVTASPPITYVWQATGHAPQAHAGGGWNDDVSFVWNTPGPKTITVTAANAGGAVSNTHNLSVHYAPPDRVEVAGPARSAVNVAYAFEASVNPITATQPITYAWQATGQAPVTHAGGLSDVVTFIWDTPGPKTIIVTATNAGGTTTSAHDVNVRYAPPDSVEISGPAQGAINTAYTFRAAASPVTATQPITYTWQASGQSPQAHTGGLSDAATFAWHTLGPKTITVTATNAGGTITNTALITILRITVDVTGPAVGAVHITHTFRASVSPITATQPITYAWQASGHSPLTRTNGLSDAVLLTWSTPGRQTITVMATNAEGVAADVHHLTINAPPQGLEITGPTTGTVNTAYSFYATVGPGTATQPITYTWQATGQAPVTHADAGLNDAITFAWPTPGAPFDQAHGRQTITVTASNAGGKISGTHLITINDVLPRAVEIAGPTVGALNTAYTFQAIVGPITTTPPITYFWRASGQTPLTRAGGLSDTVSFAWPASGPKTITVTATNVGNTVSDTHHLSVNVPPVSLSIAGPVTGMVNISYHFYATTGPITATRPLVYVWQASEQSPQVHTSNLSDTATFSWTVPGAQTITVTALNVVGMSVNVLDVDIHEPQTDFGVYLPLILKDD